VETFLKKRRMNDMKKIMALLCGMLLVVFSNSYTKPVMERSTKYRSLNDMNLNAAIRRQAAPNRLPLTGYFQDALESGRTVKLYIADGAPIRTYFTIIGVPDGVDTTEFLNTTGWFDYAKDMEEALLILEPANRTWAANESAYIRDAIAWLNSTQVNGTSIFSTFGEWYFVGYGKSAAPMEMWAADNPTRVIAQAYVDGPGADSVTLAASGAKTYGVGAQTPNMDSVGFNSSRTIHYNETPIPTYYVTGDDAQIVDSLSYWNGVNDVVVPGSTENATAGPALGGPPPVVATITTYKQKGNSTRPATEYWNYKVQNENVLSNLGVVTDTTHGIAKTIVYKPVSMNADYSSYTKPITEFLSWYTRYENINGHANFLAPRADYRALGIEVKEAYLNAATNSRRRQYSLYAPPDLGSNYPLLIVLPGNSQTNRVYMDATQWWYVAAKEKFLLVVLSEDYNPGWTTVSHYDTNAFVKKVIETLVSEYPVDRSRIYATGQSAGSDATQTLGLQMPQYFGAIASTSLFVFQDPVTGADKPIPTFVLIGEGDMPAVAGGVWGDPITSSKGQTLSPSGLGWANYHLANWGLPLEKAGTAPTVSTADLTYYQSTITYGSTDTAHPYQTWTWLKDGSPVLRYGKTDDRPHNCYPSEMQQLWDFMKHYRVEANGDRYYSALGDFSDEVKIN
jgi:hypothetical protein